MIAFPLPSTPPSIPLQLPQFFPPSGEMQSLQPLKPSPCFPCRTHCWFILGKQLKSGKLRDMEMLEWLWFQRAKTASGRRTKVASSCLLTYITFIVYDSLSVSLSILLLPQGQGVELFCLSSHPKVPQQSLGPCRHPVNICRAEIKGCRSVDCAALKKRWSVV